MNKMIKLSSNVQSVPLFFVILIMHAINTCQIHQDEQTLMRNVSSAPGLNKGLSLRLKREHNVTISSLKTVRMR